MPATTRSAPSVREQQRRTTWRALQAAALELVGRDGLAEVTVDDIAAAAGTSRRTFFNHFPTKAAALFDPDPSDAERLRAALDAASGSDRPWAALREALTGFVAGHEDVIVVRRTLVGAFPELDQYHRAAHRHVELALEEWARRHAVEEFTALLVARTAAAVLTSAFTAWQADDDPAELPALVARGFDLVAAGFAGGPDARVGVALAGS